MIGNPIGALDAFCKQMDEQGAGYDVKIRFLIGAAPYVVHRVAWMDEEKAS